ncbi:hypothetical protein [Actinomadura atramentaria]|uniref:hypothetical protein n=1 Tax=Actinomadura atramentaria TaxID=1990 RepID=UPI000379DD77|nr:hypothetical protein [Actinomadura atramentaria]
MVSGVGGAGSRTGRPSPPFFLSVRGDAGDEVAALWTGLADGAAVIEEFGPSPWAPAFGMLRDRFGVT